MDFSPAPILARLPFACLLLLFFSFPSFAQRPPSSRSGSGIPTVQSNPITVNVCVRDARGLPLEFAASVWFHSVVNSYTVKLPTGENSTASFSNVFPGEYEVEVRAVGYLTNTQPVSVVGFGGDFYVYVYLQPEGSDATKNVPPDNKVLMSPKLRGEIEKGFASMQKKDYSSARSHFLKASQLAPSNPDLIYLLGTAELGLKNFDAAKADFNSTLKLDPSHQKAFIALAETDLQTGDLSGSITALEKAYDLNGADWRIHYLLASAYARAGRLADAEQHALRAANLAKERGAFFFYLLGEIQLAEHKTAEAQTTWKRILVDFPSDPIVPKTKLQLETVANSPAVDDPSANPAPSAVTNAVPKLPLAPVMPVALISVEEHPWAPPDIDSMEYRLAGNTPCNINEILARADYRLKSQLMNFEKFTATERIEHQQVDRHGVPGPVRSKEFSYIVFVHELPPDTLYLEESRLEGNDLSSFPTPLATTGLNSLGVSVLQASSTADYEYRCEGLTSLRGGAVWQLRFEQRKGAVSPARQWNKNGQIINIPLRGRLWLTASNFDLLRIETDLLNPLPQLELNLDHLIVDYGPVNFQDGHVKLWLPWSAEMFMQLHGNRYHHKHYLTNYLLFSVDSNHKISAPKKSLPPTINLPQPPSLFPKSRIPSL
jgi:tetratricopeptide (TPR) repeat protein